MFRREDHGVRRAICRGRDARAASPGRRATTRVRRFGRWRRVLFHGLLVVAEVAYVFLGGGMVVIAKLAT
eukprot:11167140-Lingulodinium_polyedra.AAC.1